MGFTRTETPEQRFARFVFPVTESGCWIWMGALNPVSGYGCLTAENKVQTAHRRSWKIHRGPIPAGQNVCHHCDIRCCVNPDHLYLGTQRENLRDMVKRGRGRKVLGEARPTAKLTDETVRAIRASSKSNRALAVEYSVSYGVVGKVRRRSAWSHVA